MYVNANDLLELLHKELPPDVAQRLFDCLRSAAQASAAAVPVDRYREAARHIWAAEGEIEIDDDAAVSPSEGGAYVAAWVWVESEVAQ